MNLNDLQAELEIHCLKIVRKDYLDRLKQDIYLHKYDDYEHYKAVQIKHNKRKLNKIWADEKTLSIIVDYLNSEFSEKELNALCHGTRNGYEQNYFAEKLRVNIVGTDISDSVLSFPRSIHWDFHEQKTEWLDKHDFIYTNSLDQSWQPQVACKVWLNQLRLGGILFIEHSIDHSPAFAGEMDPFGVKPAYMPYVLIQWFAHQISIKVIKSVKANIGTDVWLFVVKKLVNGQISE